MKLKTKPIPPVRTVKKVKEDLDEYAEWTLTELIERFGPDAKIVLSDDSWDSIEPRLEVTWTESDESLARRQEQYEKDIASYEAWYQENKEAIELELQIRKDKQLYRKARELERQQKEAKKRKKELEAELAKVQAILSNG
jgi:predicted RNase H-like nuclease (RuvC/YqgF family)